MSTFRISTGPANPSTKPARPQQTQPSRLTWAERLKRAFEYDVTLCPLCGGTLRVIADITDPAVIDKILCHIRQSRAPPAQAARTNATTTSRHPNHHIA